MANEILSIGLRKVNDIVILDLTGRMILGESVEALRLNLRKVLDAGTKLVAINLAGVVYMDSTGIGSLAAALTSAKKAEAKLKIYGASPKILAVMKRPNLHVGFGLLTDEASALSSFHSQ